MLADQMAGLLIPNEIFLNAGEVRIWIKCYPPVGCNSKEMLAQCKSYDDKLIQHSKVSSTREKKLDRSRNW